MKIRFYSDAYKITRASHRLRGHNISESLKKQGIDSSVFTSWEEIDHNTAVVFLKGSRPESIQRARDLGAFTVYDLCDNKFGEKEEYVPCCLAAHMISASNENMVKSVHAHTGCSAVVLSDPYERPLLPAHFKPHQPIKLLWFGSQSSFKFFPLVEVLQRLEREIVHYQFTIISAKTQRVSSKLQTRQNKGQVSGINLNKIKIEDWTWQRQGELLAESDIVLMPVQTNNPRTDTKTANRLIDSLVSGCFVITTPLASYLEFANYTWQHDYIQGIKWAMAHPERVNKAITRGQKYTSEKFSPDRISLEFYHRILNAQQILQNQR